MIINDLYFKARTLSSTPNPYSTIWTAAHGDYCEDFIGDEWTQELWPDEHQSWALIEKNLLHNHRPHAGPLEHAQIVIAIGGFPHDVMVQHRTHRLASFDVQSQRYTGQRVVDMVENQREIEEVFYFRPVGKYKDRVGHYFEYTDDMRQNDIWNTRQSAITYTNNIALGMPPEMARQYLSQNIRQNYTFSCNARSILHFFNMRTAKDAQIEIQTLCEYIFIEFTKWMPELAEYYRNKYWGKSSLGF